MSLLTTTHERLEKIWSDAPGGPGFFSSVDHKRVGNRYLVTTLITFLAAGIMALVMRTQLAGAENAVLGPRTYNQLFTMHGTAMIFFFNTPIWAGFGNYFLPMMIGTRDMAFPRMNMFSYWILFFATILLFSSFVIGAMPTNSWTSYPPFNNTTYSPGINNDFWGLAVNFVGISSTVGAINFIVTTFKMRAPGMTVSRIPIFVWGIVVMSFMILFAFPSITLATALLEIDRIFDFAFFDASRGGDPVLYQHLFWVWGHPEVYIVFVPATALVSDIIATFSRRPVAARLFVVAALVSVGFISFGVWVHHMFTVGLGFLVLSFFAAASFLVTIPSGIQFYSWIATMWKGRPRFPTPMLYALGMMFIFLLGGITGVMVAMVPFDWQAHDSYFVVAHFHYTLVGGSVFPVFAGLYYWVPKISGRLHNELVGRISFWMTFIGFNVAFFPLHIVGLMGMPRRYYTYPAGLGWDDYHLVSTIGAFVLGIGFVVALANLLVPVIRKRRTLPAGANPWDAGTLEWATSSPPPSYNFLEMPVVTSAYPVWDERHREGAIEEPEHGEETLLPHPGEKAHFTLVTGGIDSVRQAIMEMPEPTTAPFWTAFGIFLIFVGLVIQQVFVGGVGAFILISALVYWFLPRWEPEEIEHEVMGEGRHP